MSDPRARLELSLSDSYRLERELGSGGMAIVYLGYDVRHKRRVALKVLRPEVSAIIGPERFLREIETLANLTHPHILPLHDSGAADGLLYYVMPYIEGESLRDRLVREKQLPLDDALRIAREVADALSHAHSRGVIHRDIKPENILLAGSHALVADFGIAAAIDVAGGSRLTETGIAVGTPAYMSPEQALGERNIDARADIYGLGCVLYEMLAGEPPFTGPSAQVVIAKVRSEEPRPITNTRKSVPAHVAAALDRALAKLPADRWPTGAHFAEALDNRMSGRVMVSAVARFARRHVWIPLATGALGAALGWFATRTPPASAPRPVWFSLVSDAGEFSMQRPVVSIAADGNSVVYRAATPQGVPQLVHRSFDRLDATPIAGSERAQYPAMSRDGKSVAFLVEDTLKIGSLERGPTTTVGRFRGVRGMSWAPGNILVLGTAGGLSRISTNGGRAHVFTTLDLVRGETAHRWPIVLPDGKTILYTSVRGVPEDSARIGIGSLETDDVKSLDLPGAYALGIIAGHVIYVDAAGRIMAAPVNLRRRVLTGEPVQLLEGVSRNNNLPTAALSSSGSLAYLPHTPSYRLVIVEPGRTPRVIIDRREIFGGPTFSPDGTQIAVSIGNWPRTSLWVYTLASGALISLAAGEAGSSFFPAWTPDGKRVAFSAYRPGDQLSRVLWQAADASAPAELLASGKLEINEVTFVPDGGAIIYRESDNADFVTSQQNIAYRKLRASPADTASHTLLGSPFREMHPDASPNGHYLAYVSNETGHNEVYVQSLPGPPYKVPVSAEEATEPRWSDDSHLFYRTAGRKIVAATVVTTSTFKVVSRQPVLDDRYVLGTNHQQYDVAADGKTFVFSERIDSTASLMVVLNWGSDVATTLRKRR